MTTKRKKGHAQQPPAEERHWYGERQRARAAKRSAKTGGKPPAGAGKGSAGKGPAQREPTSSSRSDQARQTNRSGGPAGRAGDAELVTGRNPVVEALRARVPATALHVAKGLDSDDRVRAAVSLAAKHGVAIVEGTRGELDRLAGDAPHQGLALRVPAYSYAHPGDLLERARSAGEAPLLVALDGVTDPHNLGAVIRSVAAFGGHGVVVPQRRSAGVTAATWKASAGALARVPVARASNLSRALASYKEQDVFVVGLTGSGAAELGALAVATEPLVIVTGSEGKGLSKVVSQTCDLTARVPIESATESLNASVAAGIAMYEVARMRRSSG